MKIDWKHFFNWEIVAIKAPETVKRDGCVVGYRVVVTYKYHGTDEEFYALDDERLHKVWVGPKEAAQVAYKQHLHNMRKQMKRQSRIR